SDRGVRIQYFPLTTKMMTSTSTAITKQAEMKLLMLLRDFAASPDCSAFLALLLRMDSKMMNSKMTTVPNCSMNSSQNGKLLWSMPSRNKSSTPLSSTRNALECVSVLNVRRTPTEMSATSLDASLGLVLMSRNADIAVV